MTTLGLEYLKHKESVRANQAKEAENFRSNRERERENTRHNVVTEGQKYVDLSLSSQTLAETQRANQAKERLNEIKQLGDKSDIASIMAYDKEYGLTRPEKMIAYTEAMLDQIHSDQQSNSSSLSSLGSIAKLISAFK